MSRDVLVPLLKAVVFPNIVQVITTDHNSPLHLGLCDYTSEDTSTDGHIPSKWALFVDVGAIDSLKRK